MGTKKKPEIPLPKGRRRQVRSAVLNVISLAPYATAYTRSWAVDSPNGRVRLKAENDRLLQEVALEREASRIRRGDRRRGVGGPGDGPQGSGEQRPRRFKRGG